MQQTTVLTCACILMSSILFFSCGGDDKDGILKEVDPSDANALSQVLVMPDGVDQTTGNIPVPTTTPETPRVEAQTPEIVSSNGNTFVLVFSYENVTGDLEGIYVQVAGANTHFIVPVAPGSNSSGQITLPIGIPTNVLEGAFSLNFSIYDGENHVSNVTTAAVDVLKLGSGALQISLSWNNDSDQDLYVLDPIGTSINYTHEVSASGGELDRDDTDGYGPENIFWKDNAPDGTYQVSVHDFSGTSQPTTYIITINAPGKSKTFTGTTQGGSTAEVVTITKSGTTYSF
jgi:hypothetical protein